MTLHRWDYDEVRCHFVCVKADIGLDNERKCHGCGKVVAETSVRTFWGNRRITGLHTTLDLLAATESK